MGSLGQQSRRGAREGKAESEQTGGMWHCHCTLQSAFRSTCAHIVPPRCLGVQEIMEDRTVSMDNSMSVTEIHARNRILQRCGVEQSEYHVVFTPGAKEALMLVGEAYPFCKHNVYMTALDEEWEVESQFGGISQFATFKVCPPAPPSPITSGVEIVSCEICVQESKVIPAPLAWLDLRIAGSQLSTNFRRKSKSNPTVTPPPPTTPRLPPAHILSRCHGCLCRGCLRTLFKQGGSRTPSIGYLKPSATCGTSSWTRQKWCWTRKCLI